MALSCNEVIFKGSLSKFEQKEGDGEEIHNRKKGIEHYIGNFKRDAYNGNATYSTHLLKYGSWAYDGNFCANSLEGYGAMSYGDATYFTGLFKDDKPFGPGVLTYANSRQDVGIWYGSHIYRLCTTVGDIEKLTNSPQDRVQVAKFKKLIAINQPPRDIASIILKSLSGSDDYKIDPSVLYSRFCKNPRSYFYNHQYFNDDLDDLEEIEQSLKAEDESLSEDQIIPSSTVATKFINTGIVQTQKEKYEGEEEDEEFYENSRIKNKFKPNSEVFVLSWNNTPKVIDIMKHSFKHRKQEESPDFDIGNILCGRRRLFRMRGPKENGSIKILDASSKNDVMGILKQLHRHTLSVDVMDNKGNSMILRAAANDAMDVMQLLHFLGADIDAVNDEGFSALTHTLTRFVALTYDVTNWSHGFLKKKEKYEEIEDEDENWFDECMMSNISLNRGSLLSLLRSTRPRTKKFKKYIMSEFQAPPRGSEHLRRYNNDDYNEPKSEYVFEFTPEPRYGTARKPNNDYGNEAKVEKAKKLQVIQKTAFYLLDIGADIHVSSTPAPVMVLAIFSGNLRIVEKLLKNGAEANEIHNMNNGQITALHIIAQARPLPTYPAMVNLFLRYGADPNLRTSPNYNIAEWEYLLEHVKILQDGQGLTPLQILAMRSDATYATNKEYLEQICCLLSWFSNHNELFMGLSPLGLAISKGNNNIVSTMLKCAKINVNDAFDSFWGNPLFTYLRCHGFRDDVLATDILRTLILNGADPLETCITHRGKGNALNFIPQLREKKLKGQSKWTVFGYATTPNDYNLKNHEHILMELAKLNLRKHIRGILVRLHLKYINSMDTEKEDIQRQVNVAAKNQVENESLSEAFYEEENIEYGYPEICERTQDWMNSFDEFKYIMEKTIEKLGDPDSQVQAVRLISLLPSLSIRPKRPEMKSLKLTRLIGEKKLPDLMQTRREFVNNSAEYDDEEKGDEEKNLKWIRHFVALHNNSVHVYPEMEKNRSKYVVCYHCLKQSNLLQACPICRLVYFCSLKCNIADSEKPDPYHRCGVVFWNMNTGHFFAIGDEKLNRIRRTKLYLSRLKKKYMFNASPPLSEAGTTDYGQQTDEEQVEDSEEEEELWTGRTRGIKRTLSSAMEISKKRVKHVKHARDTKKLKIKDKSKLKKWISKAKKSRKPSRSSEFRSRHGHGRGRSRGAVSGEESEVDTFGLIERDYRLEAIGANAQIDMAARLLEKQSYILEQKKLEADRLKEAQDNIDSDLLGLVAPPEEFWDKDEEKGEGKKQHSSEERFSAFLKMLERHFVGFDLEKYFPFIVFVDGVMYYKYYGTETKYKENYSFN